jgi:hypothetical protein
MNTLVRESALSLYTANAKGIAFDTCHKIYVLMDDQQMELMRGYGYDLLISSDEMTPEELEAQVAEWYDDSCSLRFIQAVSTNTEDPNEGFVSIVAQGADWDEDEDEDED